MKEQVESDLLEILKKVTNEYNKIIKKYIFDRLETKELNLDQVRNHGFYDLADEYEKKKKQVKCTLRGCAVLGGSGGYAYYTSTVATMALPMGLTQCTMALVGSTCIAVAATIAVASIGYSTYMANNWSYKQAKFESLKLLLGKDGL